jgi:hypothetical protein
VRLLSPFCRSPLSLRSSAGQRMRVTGSTFRAMAARSILSAVLLMTAACATGPTASPLVITTDRTSYTVGAAGTVTVVTMAVNRDQAPLYVGGCDSGPVWLLATRQTDGQWALPFTPCSTAGLNGISGYPYPAVDRLGAGTAITDTTILSGSGTYRLELGSSADSGVAARQLSVSNTFVVVGSH